MYKDVKLIDVSDRVITLMFQNSKQWYSSFDICNPNHLYPLTKPRNKAVYFLKLVMVKKVFV